jgi:hypothetical protein
MCKRSFVIGTLVSTMVALTGVNAMAIDKMPVAYYTSAQVVYSNIKVSGESFSPILFQFKAEAAFTDGLLDGIGLQGVVAVPISSVDKHGLTLDVKQQSGIYLTLTNPETQPDDLKVSVLLGYASTDIETALPALGNNSNHKDTFSDFSYGISLQDRIMENRNFYWTLDYLRYYKDDNLRIDGLGLGVTYAF